MNHNKNIHDQGKNWGGPCPPCPPLVYATAFHTLCPSSLYPPGHLGPKGGGRDPQAEATHPSAVSPSQHPPAVHDSRQGLHRTHQGVPEARAGEGHSHLLQLPGPEGGHGGTVVCHTADPWDAPCAYNPQRVSNTGLPIQ